MLNEQIWNQFSRQYVAYLEQLYYPSAQILFDQLNVDEEFKVLEVGTGGGYYLKQFAIQKPKSCHWYATDFCEVMLQICQQRLEEFRKHPFIQIKHNYVTEEFPPFQEQCFEELGITILKADSRDLKQFASNIFDRYFANQILKEAWRVLKPEGIIGITVQYLLNNNILQVFGRKENCNCMTIFQETGIELGMDPKKFPEKDEFDFTEKNLIISQIEKAGFSIKNCFYMSQPLGDSVKGIDHLSNTNSVIRIKLQKAGADDEMIKKIQIALKEKQSKMHELTKSPLMMEILFITAQKPKQ